MTFELPPPLVQRLRAYVPAGQRSKFVGELISRRLVARASTLEKAARKANRLTRVAFEMKDWEALNGYED